MGKLLDKIKEILFGKKQMMLPSGNIENNYNIRNKINDMSNFKNSQVEKANNGVKNAYLEKSLSLYFEEYLRQLDESKVTGNIPTSYRALTRINATKGNYELNRQSEVNLLEHIFMSEKYHVQEQKFGDSNKCCFYHVQSKGYKLPDNNDMIRIYINCKDENVAGLAGALLSYNQNPNFYLKFDSTESMRRSTRIEKIVIYTDDEHLNQDIGTIKQVKKNRPYLLEGSEKMNPFMQQFENMFSMARQVNGNELYIDLKGNTKEIANSNNSYIAEILQDSYTEAVRDIAKRDPKLSFLLNDNNKNNYNLYVQNYRYMHIIMMI